MITDRELLEAAARAAGIDARLIGDGMRKILGSPTDPVWRSGWNPLTDDGDALRLAVECKADIAHNKGQQCEGVGIFRAPLHPHHADMTMYAFEPYGDDRNAATRRAIVRAAAALGGLS